ncbi:rhodanese-like domain-containing protein [Aerococcaceae bacterium zg-ZJ1578]|uniref:rhodanese-like domain-containing protein n=1 Tax=Aerococcaceae TaxID=186827 RepID=UPI0013B5CDB2|nr:MULTISPECIES: rhodanese-like domain-containing protein [unclassified Facklamia]MBK0347534.1 rhodanese-like domain-containing protein [Aerococcaceae bacterium zg-1578]NEW63569.1 rhodanese-like domain-containing protein [Facklamia sp. 252]NEW67040.1 rhodanese-like domain-containing protein [Facklamia sp. 253]QQD66412.1 rhodanese-like domain-containing protein [Aerococcaceae bacterium zg-252]
MDLLIFIFAVLVLTIVAYGAYLLYLWLIRKYSATLIEAEELEEKRAGAQIIDLREAAEFDARHILGARNLPMSQFSQRYKEVRKDKPVYLYDDNMNLAPRAARTLKKNGYDNIYVLKNGFSTWGGKVRSSK